MYDKIKITEIKPANYNPRLISEKDFWFLKNSIENYGLVDPIVINSKTKTIIGGHQRYDVLFNQYIENNKNEFLNIIKIGDISWCFVDDDLEVISEDHEKALNLALNKISGEWDIPKLNDLFNDIDDLSLTGFDTESINDLQLENVDEIFEQFEDEDDAEDTNMYMDSNSGAELSYKLIFITKEEEILWNNFLSKINNHDESSIASKIVNTLYDIIIG